MSFSLMPIGVVSALDRVSIEPAYRSGLAGLEGFSHLVLTWWADGADTPEVRRTVTVDQPYVGGPHQLGVFATRSPCRPNPVGITVVHVQSLDVGAGTIDVDFIDADRGTPVVDIKPYTPSLDRVAAPQSPQWCSQWPDSVETSGDYDWDSVFA